ncbi:S-layer homology domain-containing protein [Paenibacillus sp. KS-LC4]|uniref:S-layer homology domain-containing protein n=1 Tax=Paenibacillus sp. KS-LC4 TaxID=2979727 RepID=UPI0030D371F8
MRHFTSISPRFDKMEQNSLPFDKNERVEQGRRGIGMISVMSLKIKKWIGLLLVVTMLTSLMPGYGTASAATKEAEAELAAALSTMLANGGTSGIPDAPVAQPSDISGNWAQGQIEDWIDKQLIFGFPDGTFKPNNKISRAELAAIINRAFSFSEQASSAFNDVPAAKWYSADIAKAQAAGYMQGDGNGSFRPDAPVSRQEAAVVLAKLLKLDTAGSDSADKFGDSNKISAWSKGAVSAALNDGLINGYGDHTFRPTQPISRAETVVILDRALKMATGGTDTADLPTALIKAGTYGPENRKATYAGDLTIDAPDVVLRNVTITGNLVLGEGIGEGDVTLDGVTVLGTTTVKGGGKNSIHLLDSALTRIIITKVNGQVRVVIEGSTAVDQATVTTGATLQVVGGGGASFGTVEVSTAGEVTLSGNFPNVVLVASATVTITDGSVDNLTLTDLAAGAKIEVNETAKVSSLNVGSAATISGQGAITNATITATGVTMAQKPDKVAIAQSISAQIGGQTVQGTLVSSGSSGSSGSTTTASPGPTSSPAPTEPPVSTATPISVTVSNPSTAGLTISLVPPLPGLTTGDLVLTNPEGYTIFNSALSTTDNGSTYQYSGIFRGGDTYALSIAKSGYSFGSSKTIAIPDLTAFTGAILSPDGGKVTLLFTKELARLSVSPAGFAVKSGGEAVAIVSAEKVSGARVDLTLASEIGADHFELSYTPGAVTSTDSKPLVAFKATSIMDGTTAAGIVNYSKLEGKSAAEAADALQEQNGGSLTGAEIGTALLEGGYSGIDVVKMLSEENYFPYPDTTAIFLIEQGYGVTNALITLEEAGLISLGNSGFGKAMKHMGITAKDLFQAMKFKGYGINTAYEESGYFDNNERYAALRQVFGLTEEELAAFLNEKFVSAREAAAVMQASKASTPSSIVTALQRANYTEEQVGEILKSADLFNVNAYRAVALLLDAGFNMHAASKIMKDYYGASADQIVAALALRGMTFAEIVEVIGSGTLGFTQEERWAGLRAAYTTKQVAAQYLKWEWTASELISYLANAHYPAEEVEEAVSTVYSGSRFLDGSIEAMLWDNYTISEVAAGMKRSGDSIKVVAELLASKGYKNIFSAGDEEETIVDMLLKAGFSVIEIAQYLRPFGSRQDSMSTDEMGRVLLQFKDAGFTAVELTNLMSEMIRYSSLRSGGAESFVILMYDMTDLTTDTGRTLTKFSADDIPRVLAARGLEPKEMKRYLSYRFATSLQIAELLKTSFSFDAAELLEVIRTSNSAFCGSACRVNELLRIIKASYSDLTYEEAASVLYSSGFSSNFGAGVFNSDLINGVREVYGGNPNLVPMFRRLGEPLGSLINLSAYSNYSSSSWRSNGYTAIEVLPYLLLGSVGNLQDLKNAGYSLEEIVLAANKVYGESGVTNVTATGLYSAEEIADAAAAVLGQDSKATMARQMRDNHGWAYDTANALRTSYDVTDPVESAMLLQGAGYSQNEVLGGIFYAFCAGNAFSEGTYATLNAVIRSLYSEVTDPLALSLNIADATSPTKGVNIFRTIGYTPVQIVTVLKEQYQLSSRDALRVYLNAGGATPITILTAISSVFNVEAASFVTSQEKTDGKDAYMTRKLLSSNYGYTDELAIAKALADGGYSQEQVLAAMFHQSGNRNILVASILKQNYSVTDLGVVSTWLRNLGESTSSTYQALRSVYPDASTGDVITKMTESGYSIYTIFGQLLDRPESDAKNDSTIAAVRGLGLEAKYAMGMLQGWGYSLKDRFSKLRTTGGYTFEELGEAMKASGETGLSVAAAMASLRYSIQEVAPIVYAMDTRYQVLALYLYGAGWYDPAVLAMGLLEVGCPPEDIITELKSMVDELLLDYVFLKKIEAPIPNWTSTYMAIRLSWTDMSMNELAQSLIKAVDNDEYRETDLFWGLRALVEIGLFDQIKADLPADAGDYLYGRNDGIPFMVLKESGLSANRAAGLMHDLGIQWQPAIMFLIQANYSSSDIASAFFSHYSLDVLLSVAEIIATIATSVSDGKWSNILKILKIVGQVAFNVGMKNYHTDFSGNPDRASTG